MYTMWRALYIPGQRQAAGASATSYLVVLNRGSHR